MLKTNKDRVVKLSILVEISHPVTRMPVVDGQGGVHYVPGLGGITYNFGIGDNAFGLYGDHVEPDVSAKNSNKDLNPTCMALACIGNEAVVISGDAKGMKGYVIGKHGGIEHVLIWLPDKEKLAIGDKIQIKAWGQGLELSDFPTVRLMNIDPELFEKIPLEEHGGRLHVPVAAVVPAHLTGSGVGASNTLASDYDMNTLDYEEVKRYGLDRVRIGDLVAVKDHYCAYGAGGFRPGAVSIAVVVHSNCLRTGHGPGMVIIMTSPDGTLVPNLVERSNIGTFLGILPA